MATLRLPEHSSAGVLPALVLARSAPNGRAVLLVEDNDDLREVMGVLLHMGGYKVISCNCAELASEAFRFGTVTADVLLTDIQMPGRSGVELARELTSLRPSLPVLIVSAGWITTGMSEEFRERGWKFLSKPTNLACVLETIGFLLRIGDA